MTESEFLERSEAMLQRLEAALERALPDADLQRTGPVLTVQNDDGETVVINSHAAAQEIWLASRKGGLHFRWAEDGRWLGTRDASQELMAEAGRALGVQLAGG